MAFALDHMKCSFHLMKEIFECQNLTLYFRTLPRPAEKNANCQLYLKLRIEAVIAKRLFWLQFCIYKAGNADGVKTYVNEYLVFTLDHLK